MYCIADEFWPRLVGPSTDDTRDEHVITGLALMGPRQYRGDNAGHIDRQSTGGCNGEACSRLPELER